MQIKGKIYFITRTWDEKIKANNSCSMMRILYAESLAKIAEIVIVTPAYNGEEVITDNQISFCYNGEMLLVDNMLQYAGIYDDYLDRWTKKTYNYMKNIVKKDDIVFAVTGGELGCVKLGSMLQIACGCKYIVHFHDPIDGDVIFGRKVDIYKGPERSKKINKYLKNADGMLTCSATYKEWLDKTMSDKSVYNHYMGYATPIDLKDIEKKDEVINIVYAGTMSPLQNSKILYEAVKGIDKVKVTYICAEAEKEKMSMPEDNIECIPLMPNAKFLEYMKEKADIGFTSLAGRYGKVFVPTKIFEYINLGLPILASVPKDGSAATIIEEGGYGMVSEEDNVEQLREVVLEMIQGDNISRFKQNILNDRDSWSFASRESEFLDIFNKLLEN